jgi:hypothetical protein
MRTICNLNQLSSVTFWLYLVIQYTLASPYLLDTQVPRCPESIGSTQLKHVYSEPIADFFRSPLACGDAAQVNRLDEYCPWMELHHDRAPRFRRPKPDDAPPPLRCGVRGGKNRRRTWANAFNVFHQLRRMACQTVLVRPALQMGASFRRHYVGHLALAVTALAHL